MARQPDPARLGPLGALPSRIVLAGGRARRTAIASSTGGCSRRVEAHDPKAAGDALFAHLELASLFFETELGGQGIFARPT